MKNASITVGGGRNKGVKEAHMDREYKVIQYLCAIVLGKFHQFGHAKATSYS